MRVLIEVIHVVVGLAAALLIAAVAAWSYPRAKADIWLVTYGAMIAVVAMGVRPVRRAYLIDRETLRGTDGAHD